MKRRDFLKVLGLSCGAPLIPFIPKEPVCVSSDDKVHLSLPTKTEAGNTLTLVSDGSDWYEINRFEK
jgi:hypothetical protein